MSLKLVVVYGSVRSSRQGIKAARFALDLCRRRGHEAVLVDLQPLLPPYRVSAIGNPSALEVALASGMVGPYLDVLRGDGIVVKVDARPSLVLAGAPGTVGVSHASTVPSRTPGTSPSPARPEPEVSR